MMIKVSRVFLAHNWVHAWLEPNGTFHDTLGESHGAWAFKNLKRSDADLLNEGWIRLGAYDGAAYIHTVRPMTKLTFSQAQIWIMEHAHNANEILITDESQNVAGLFPLDDFLEINEPRGLKRFQRVDKTAALV
jgi:hypothetical protein